MSLTTMWQFLSARKPDLISGGSERRAGSNLIRSAPARTAPALTQPARDLVSSLPRRYLFWLHRHQVWAGWRFNKAFGLLSAVKVYPALLFLLSAIVVPLWLTVPIILLGFLLPDLVVFMCSRKRRQRIKESLPQALDLMVLCVDAGLGLDATLQRIASEQTAVSQELNQELLILSRDVLLGMDRAKAYQELYDRTGVDELRALGSSLNQSSKLGISVARILREQSEYLRKKLAQLAEEKAAKLPIYMAFPLWFCIMPALMVILLAPSFIIFFNQIKPFMFK